MKIGPIMALLLASLVPQEPMPERLGVLPGISQPHSLRIVDNDLVFLDGFTVHVYSLNPFARKNSFAGQGDGPDQFRYWPRLALRGDTVIGTDFLKASFFTLQGKLLDTIPYSEFEDFDTNTEMVLLPAGESFLRITVDHDTNRRIVRLIASDRTLTRTLYEGLYDWRGALPPHRIEVDSDNEHIVVSDSDKGFFLSLYDTRGTLLGTIDKSEDMEPIPFTDADRAAYLEAVRWTQDPRVYAHLRENGRFKDWFPLINHVQLDGGKLYVTTNRERDGGHELLVLDLEGRLLETHFLPLRSMNPSRGILRFDPYVIHDGKLYEIVRWEATGVFELWVTDLER